MAAYTDGLKSLPPKAQMTATDHNLEAQCEHGLQSIHVKLQGPNRMSNVSNGAWDEEQMP